MSLYAKALAALLGGLAAWLATALGDGGIELDDTPGLLLALSTAVAVFAVPNARTADSDESQAGDGEQLPRPRSGLDDGL